VVPRVEIVIIATCFLQLMIYELF